MHSLGREVMVAHSKEEDLIMSETRLSSKGGRRDKEEEEEN